MQKTSLPIILLLSLIVNGCSHQAQLPKILNDFVENGASSILPDFSYAGYAYGQKEIEVEKYDTFNVLSFGAIPNDEEDDTHAIQNAVDAAGKNEGGGVVYFPAGVFNVNMDTAKLDIIRINYGGVVLKGAGSGEDGTIIFSGSQTTQAEDNSPWLSPFVFHTGLNLFGTDRFYSIDDEAPLAKFTKDAKKGKTWLTLQTTAGIEMGDYLIMAMRNTTDNGDLMHYLMNPLKFEDFQTSYLNAGKNRYPSYQWFAEVKKVVNETQVELMQPLRRDMLTKYQAFVAKMPMLTGIGIEGFRFECAYKGGYTHHLNREHDYGWGAICMHRVAHGWVRDIHINNYVQNVHLVNSRNVSVSDVTMTGMGGHYSIKMYHSHDNLVQHIDIQAHFTHGPGLEGASSGNVYRNIKLAYPSPIDLHGLGGEAFCPPMYNLYENIDNLTAAAGGGAPANIPHAGEYNVFWNLGMEGMQHGDFKHELFHSWIWRDTIRFAPIMHQDCHKQYLRTIVVGVHHPSITLTIEQSPDDRVDDWIYVEGLNQDLKLPSLYEFQLKKRLAQK